MVLPIENDTIIANSITPIVSGNFKNLALIKLNKAANAVIPIKI
jgi:hypothetical protein